MARRDEPTQMRMPRAPASGVRSRRRPG
jgi:hypothetical protein